MGLLKTIFWVLVITAGICVSIYDKQARPHYESFSGTVVVDKDIAYGPAADEKMDICRPRSLRPNRPAVIMIHGGTWISGDKSGNMPLLCSLLAEKGIVVANINYRLFSVKTMANRWPSQLQDAQLAVRWLRAHAADYDIDSSRICADGISAGGQLALFLGLLKDNQPGDRAGLFAGQKSNVQCVVDDQGVADLLSVSPQISDVVAKLVVPGPDSDVTSALKEASPLFSMNAQMVPTLIIHGDGDDQVYPSQARALKEALVKNGVPVEYLSYHGGHVYTGLTHQQVIGMFLRHVQYLVERLNP